MKINLVKTYLVWLKPISYNNFGAKVKMAGMKRENGVDSTSENDDVVEKQGMVVMTKRPRVGETQSNRYREDAQTTFADDLESMEPILTEASAWPRKPMRSIDRMKDSIAFQWVDIDMYDGPCLEQGKSSQKTAIFRMYGVTEEGNSVMMHVHGFLPYFYMTCPDQLNQSHAANVRQVLEQALAQRDRDGKDLVRVCGVEYVTERMSIYGYQFDRACKLWKIYMTMPSYVAKLRSLVEQGITLPGLDCRSYQTYESNVPFTLRFMIDQDINGCNWVEAPAGTYTIRTCPQSLCQLEFDIVYTDIKSHSPIGKWSRLAPLRILSLDIECMGRKGQFPEAEKDPVIQIANVVQIQGTTNPLIRNVFVLNTCKPIVGAHVIECEREQEMLEQWARFVQQVDPDVITGYNIDNFDIPYLLNRGKALGLQTHGQLGRLQHTYVKI